MTKESISAQTARRLIADRKKKGRYTVAPIQHRTLDDITFDSKAEMERWAELQLLQRAGQIRHLRRQIEFALVVKGHDGLDKLVGRYTADFVYTLTHNESVVVEEVKSSATKREKDYRLRKKLFEALYPWSITEVVR